MSPLLATLRAGWPALLLAHTLKVSLLLLATLAATALMRRASAAARHFVWTVALAGVLALPALTLTLPGWGVPALSPLAPPAASPAPAPPTRSPSTPAAASAAGQATPTPALERVGASPPSAPTLRTAEPVAPTLAARAAALDWRAVLLLLWALGAAAIVLRLAVGVAAVWWITRRATMMTDAGWLHLAHAIAKRLGMGRGVTLLEGDRRTVPMTWGVLQPVVWLPAGAETWTEERRALVLTHELAHVRRRDALTQWIAHLALACNWFNPLAWMAVRRFRDERERACDDAVLVLGARPDVYADHLLDIVRSLGAAGGPAPAMAMARRSQFEGRLLAILDAAAPRLSVSRAGALATVGLALGAVVPVAAARPAARAEAEADAGAGSLAAQRDDASSLFDGRPVKMSLHAVGGDTAPTHTLAPRSGRAAGAHGARGAAPTPGVAAPELLALLRAPAGDTLIRQVLAAAAEMTSDGDKREVFLAVLRQPQLEQDDLALLLRAAARMTSDGDKSDVLVAALPRVSLLDAATRAALFAGIDSIRSDGDRRDVLLALGPHVTLDDAATRAAFFRAVSRFASDGDRADVLRAVLDRPGLASRAVGDVIRAAALIASDGDKADVLVAAARRQTLDAETRQAYLTVARTLTSDGDRGAALAALLPGAAAESSQASSRASSSAASRASSITAAVPVAASSSASSSARADGVPYVSSGDRRLWTTELSLNGSAHGLPDYYILIRASKVRVSADGSRIEGFEPGGRLAITHTVFALGGSAAPVTRHLEMDADHGVLPRRYTVNGAARPWDADAEAWLTAVLGRWGAKPKS